MIPGMGGTTANLRFDPAIIAATNASNISSDSDGPRVRAVKVVVDIKAELLACAATLAEGSSLEDDFLEVGRQHLEAARPCLVLIHTGGESQEDVGGEESTARAALFSTIDADASGGISREEWEQAFSSIDANGDGSISRKEWYLKQGGTSTLFDAIPRKNAAAVSRDEWLKAF